MDTNCSMPFAEFVKSFGPLISAFVALFLFHQTTLRDKKKEKKKKRLERKNRIRYITNIIGDAIKTITNQVDKIDVNVKAIIAVPTEMHPLTLFASSSIETLTKLLNEEDTFIAITKLTKWMDGDNKVDMYSQLVARADFIFAVMNDVKAQTQTRFNNMQEEHLSFQIATDNILTKTNAVLLALQKQEMTALETRFMTATTKIDAAVQASEKNDTETYHQLLVLPTIQLTNEYMVHAFSQTDKLDELRKVSEDSARIYRQSVANSKLHADGLTEMNKALLEAKDELILINEKIKTASNCEPITIPSVSPSEQGDMV